MKMEEKKTVGKSGLPIVISGVELTEKDLHCLARHLDEFVDRCWHELKEVPNACVNCWFVKQCEHPESHVVSPWESIGKLNIITGIFGNCKTREELIAAGLHRSFPTGLL